MIRAFNISNEVQVNFGNLRFLQAKHSNRLVQSLICNLLDRVDMNSGGAHLVRKSTYRTTLPDPSMFTHRAAMSILQPYVVLCLPTPKWARELVLDSGRGA